MKYLSFPFINTCELQLKTKVAEKVITCELAESVIEIFQSLNFRNEKDFIIPLILKIEDANIQSFVLTNYSFPVEHICISEKILSTKPIPNLFQIPPLHLSKVSPVLSLSFLRQLAL